MTSINKADVEITIICSKYDSNHLNEHCALGMLKQGVGEGWHDVEFHIREKANA